MDDSFDMFDDEQDPRDICEFHLGHSESRRQYQIVVSSSVRMDHKLLLLALRCFVDEMNAKEGLDLFDLGTDYLIVEN